MKLKLQIYKEKLEIIMQHDIFPSIIQKRNLKFQNRNQVNNAQRIWNEIKIH